MKIGKVDWFLIIGFVIIGLLAVFFYFYPQYGAWLDFSTWKIDKNFLGGTLSMVFLVCVIGNLLPIPTPYTFIIIPAALSFPSHFWLIGLIASFAALIGEIVGYLVGRAGHESLKRSDRNIEKIEDWKKLINQRPKMVMFLLFIFGATPLNDDNVMIPLGLAGFDFKRTVFSCYLGKLALMMLLAVGGAFGIPWIQNLAGTGTPSEFAWVEGLIIIAITLVIIWIMFKIDVKRFLKKKYGVEELEEVNTQEGEEINND
ncbi:MAG: VTT domain-containing protein [Candidatus Helarchaeota archaeon]|nr:VTT domain-containing protein [Candidatus Helarchaeota archaeon]